MKKIKRLIIILALLTLSIDTTAQNIPNDEIRYTASSKLKEVTSRADAGLHTNAFNTTIKSHTFSNGKGVIKFESDVTSIGERAFYHSSLNVITIPNSVTSIGDYAFEYCSLLMSINIPNSVTSIGERAFEKCSSLMSINIPNSVTSIGDGAFYWCLDLKSVTIPNSVTSIGSGTFVYCEALTSVIIPNSVTSIGDDAFGYCSGLTSITIPNSVTSIGDDAFYDCSGLTSIEIPNSVTSIGDGAFYWCKGLTAVYIKDIDKWAEIEFGGETANPLYYAKKLYLNGKLVTDAKLTSATKIGSYAFYYCSGLTSIEIPNSVTSLGYQAFRSCSGLTSIVIPNSVTSLGDYAFSGCSGLTSVTIGNSVTSIGDGAFRECSGLTSVTIGNSVTSIGDGAFRECSGLTSVTIGNSVTSIGDGAFYWCSGLTSVTVKATTPPTCGSSVFDKVSINGATLIVPAGGVITYKKADVWKDFGTITDGEVEFPKIKATQKEATQTTITLMLDYDKEKCIPSEEIGVKLGSKYYKANTEGIVKIEHLAPDTYRGVYAYAKYGGEYYVSEEFTSVSTKPINSEIAFSDIMANKAFVRGVYDIGDAHVYKTTFELKIPTEKGSSWTGEEIEYKNDKFTLTGLEPDTEYGVCYTVYYHYGENDEYSGSEYDKQYFTTAKLKMKTLNPKNVSSTSSVVAAEANISDDETGAGFEWRKYDAPESLPSSKGGAIVYDGRMEGKINNLQATYYSVRPYYESASGKVFYGEWITFDPTDFSYFEPTVHTYDFPEAPSTNSVEVRGYVMQGTDDVTEQGFEYWKTGGSSQRKMASNGEVMRVQATGQKMIVTLRDLDYESNYVVRAYVVTASGTVYGEERMFTTPADPTSGISEVKESESVSRSLKGIYTLDGRKIERITTPGIYLYNGKKIMFKAGQLPVE